MTEWRTIEGFSDYEVSDDGRVRSWRPVTNTQERRSDPTILQGGLDTRGYYRVKIRDDDNRPSTKKVHILVCAAFHGPRPTGYVARHLDGNKRNNTKSNLAWGTHKENMADAIRHCTWVHGERHHSNKLSEAEVIAIRMSPLSNLDIAALCDITLGMVGHIRHGRRWKHLLKLEDVIEDILFNLACLHDYNRPPDDDDDEAPAAGNSGPH